MCHDWYEQIPIFNEIEKWQYDTNTCAWCQSNSFRNRSNHETMHTAQMQLISNQSHVHCTGRWWRCICCYSHAKYLCRRFFTFTIAFNTNHQIAYRSVCSYFCEYHSSRIQSKTSLFDSKFVFSRLIIAVSIYWEFYFISIFYSPSRGKISDMGNQRWIKKLRLFFLGEIDFYLKWWSYKVGFFKSK